MFITDFKALSENISCNEMVLSLAMILEQINYLKICWYIISQNTQ